MIIKVRNKSFAIEKFVIRATKLYNEMMAKDISSLQVDEKDMDSVMEMFTKTTDLADKALCIVEIVLRTNGLKYDADWWEENADLKDVIAFLTSAYRGEVGEEVKKNPQNKVS